MTTASITAYQIDSTMPKDASGHKFWALVRSDASVAPFVFPRGLATSQADNGYLFGNMGVATHARGSGEFGANEPLMAIGGVFLETVGASEVASGSLQFIQSTRQGALVTEGMQKSTSLLSTSVNTLTSKLIHALIIAGDGVTAGDTITFEDGDNTIVPYVFGAANETQVLNFPGGLPFTTSVVITQGLTGGAASATVVYI